MKQKEIKKVLSDDDRRKIYAIMQKYVDINQAEKNFLAEELKIDDFFRHVQTEVTGEHVEKKFGTGDHGGFFF
jgi:hypothetical protein